METNLLLYRWKGDTPCAQQHWFHDDLCFRCWCCWSNKTNPRDSMRFLTRWRENQWAENAKIAFRFNWLFNDQSVLHRHQLGETSSSYSHYQGFLTSIRDGWKLQTQRVASDLLYAATDRFFFWINIWDFLHGRLWESIRIWGCIRGKWEPNPTKST